jgi:hypothetical protein
MIEIIASFATIGAIRVRSGGTSDARVGRPGIVLQPALESRISLNT